jgi:hypothetical protein
MSLGIAFSIARGVVRQFRFTARCFELPTNGIGRKMGSGGMARARIPDESSTSGRRGFLRTVVHGRSRAAETVKIAPISPLNLETEK